MRYSLRQQMLIPLLAVAIASLAAVAALSAWWVTASTQERIERQLVGVVRVLADPRFPLLQPVLEQMRDLSASEFAVTDDDGRLLATSGPQITGTEPTRELPRDAEQVELGPRIEVDGRGYYHSSLRLATATGERRPAVLHVLYPTDEYDAAWRSAFMLPLLVGVVSVGAIAIVVSLLAQRLSSATRRLGADVARLASGDFAPVDLPPREDELRDLAVAIDQTATKLKSYEQQVRQTEQLRTANMLGAALAHEMRNAATGCRMALDIHGRECDAGEADESLDVARKQLALMESRLKRFLRLANPMDNGPREAVDVVPIVDEAVSLVQPMTRHANIDLTWNKPTNPITLSVEADGLLQSVLNLLLNAIEAVRGQDSACVSIELSAETESVRLRVLDNGPGPSPDVAERMFDPFVTDKPEGAGLGLAGVSDFATAHGGRVEWNRDDGATVFVVTLPC